MSSNRIITGLFVQPAFEYLGFQAERDLLNNSAVTYNHGDLVGSTMYRATFDQQNQQTAAQQVTYTAFGEPVVPDGAGGWTVGGELPIGMRRSSLHAEHVLGRA